MNPRFYILALFFVPLAACGMALRRPAVELMIVNNSVYVLKEARVYLGGNVCGWGTVIPGGTKGYLHYPHPITPDAEMRWEGDGGPHIRKIDLKKIYPKGKSGQLVFVVFEKHIEVKFIEASWTP